MDNDIKYFKGYADLFKVYTDICALKIILKQHHYPVDISICSIEINTTDITEESSIGFLVKTRFGVPSFVFNIQADSDGILSIEIDRCSYPNNDHLNDFIQNPYVLKQRYLTIPVRLLLALSHMHVIMSA